MRLPMTAAGEPWSHCSVSCGWGTQSRKRCENLEYKACYSQDCPNPPNCSKFSVKYTQSRLKTRLDISITMKRFPGIEDSIFAQRIQLINKEDRTNGAEKTWLMTKENDTIDQPLFFQNKIQSSCNLCDNGFCRPSAENCSYSFKNLKLKSLYKITLFIREKPKSENTKTKDDKIVYHITQCPQPDMFLDIWQCSQEQSILASMLCNGVIACRNGRDEDPAVCQGEENLAYTGISILSFLGLSLAVGILVNLTLSKDSFVQEDNENEVDKKKRKEFFKNFRTRNQIFNTSSKSCHFLSKMDVFNLYSLTDSEKLNSMIEFNDNDFSETTGKAMEKMMRAHNETNQTMKVVNSSQQKKSCFKRSTKPNQKKENMYLV